MLLKNLRGFFQIGGLSGCYQTVLGHDVINFALQVTFKPEVAVGYYAHQFFIIVYYGDATNVVFFHHFQCI